MEGKHAIDSPGTYFPYTIICKKNPINTHFSTKFPPTRLFQPPRLFGILEYLRTYIEHSIVVCSFQTISLWAWKVSAIFVNDAAARASPDQPCCHDRIVQFTRYSNLRVTIVIFGELKTISNSLDNVWSIKNLTITVHSYVLWWSGFLWIRR